MAISSEDMLDIQSQVLTTDTSKNSKISFLNRLQTTDKSINKAINALLAQSKTTLKQVTNLVKSTGTKDVGFVMQYAMQGTSSAEIYFPYDGKAVNAYAILGTGNDFSKLSDVTFEIQCDEDDVWTSIASVTIKAGRKMQEETLSKAFNKGNLRVKVSECVDSLVNVSVVLSVDISGA